MNQPRFIDPFHHFNYSEVEDGEENEAYESMPDAGWNQHPEEFAGDNRPTIRWGDVKTISVPASGLAGLVVQPVLQVLDFYLQLPAVCLVRLSAQELSGVAIAGTDLITWTLLIGVGAATQTRKYQRALAPTDGTTDTDLYLTMPVEHLVATANIQVNTNVGTNRIVEIAAMVAPFTSAPWMAR